MAGHADPTRGLGNSPTGSEGHVEADAASPSGDELDARDAELFAQAAVDGGDERVLRVTVVKKKGKIGWVRDCDTLVVDEVEKGSAAEAAGIKPLMRIIQVNGVVVSTDEEFEAEMAKVSGDSFDLMLDIEEQLDANVQVILSQEVIDKARAMTLEEQVAADAQLVAGVDMFMNNEFTKAEKFFEERAATDPLAALSHAIIAFLRAVLSFSPRHLRECRRRFAKAISMANQIAPPKSKLESVKSFFSRSKERTPNYALRCRVLECEANLLKAILLLTEDSIMSHIRAGIALRRGYLDIENLAKSVDKALKDDKESKNSAASFVTGMFSSAAQATGLQVPPGFPKNGLTPPEAGDKIGHWGAGVYNLYDYNTVGGIQFGLGAVNCVISCMPARVLALLSALGFMHDRDGGFYNLDVVLATGGLRSPVAGLFLATFHGTLPSFASVLAADALPKAEALVASMLKQYPNSALYLWVAGRVARLKRDTAGAAQIFESAIAKVDKKEFPELIHICAYELAWCRCFAMEWDKAVPLFQMLYNESDWSKSFNAYASAVCLEELGRGEEAREWYARAKEKLGRKFGGRTISVEQYIERKLAFLDNAGCKSRHPGVEFMMLFNAFPQMEVEKLQAVRAMCQATIAAGTPVVSAADATDAAAKEAKDAKNPPECTVAQEQMLVVQLMEANAAKEVGDAAAAGTLYTAICNKFPQKKWKKMLKQETFVLPYAYYEHGGLHMMQCHSEKATPLFEKAEGFKDFNFEMPLSLRLHLTRDLLRRQKEEQRAEAKAAKAKK